MTTAQSRRRVLARLRLGDAGFRLLTKAAAVGVLIILAGVIVSLVHGSLPALRAFGFDFLTVQDLEPGYGKIRRAGADLRHADHLLDRDAGRAYRSVWVSRCFSPSFARAD